MLRWCVAPRWVPASVVEEELARVEERPEEVLEEPLGVLAVLALLPAPAFLLAGPLLLALAVLPRRPILLGRDDVQDRLRLGLGGLPREAADVELLHDLLD